MGSPTGTVGLNILGKAFRTLISTSSALRPSERVATRPRRSHTELVPPLGSIVACDAEEG